MPNITQPSVPNQKENPSTKKILVIDDDEHVRSMVILQLEVEGFNVKGARDGKSALSTAQQYQPDLIVSDIMMPGGGGFEVIRALQIDPMTLKTKVLLMSGGRFDKSTIDMMCQEPNVAGFYAKPLHLPTFLLKVHSLLNTKSKEERLAEERQNQPEMDIDRYQF